MAIPNEGGGGGAVGGGGGEPAPPPPPPIETSVDLWDPFGEPDELIAAAEAWEAMATRIDIMDAQLGRLTYAAAYEWDGKAYDEFAGHWGEMSPKLAEGAEGMREVAKQLRAMAEELKAKNDVVQSIWVSIGATAVVSFAASFVSFGVASLAGAANVARLVAQAKHVIDLAKAALIASRLAMVAIKLGKVGGFAASFARFAVQGAVVTAAVKDIALEQNPWDPDNWTAADAAGVGLGGAAAAGLAYRGAATAGTRARAAASALAADAATSAAVDVIGGTATPGQIATNAAISGTVGAVGDRVLGAGGSAGRGGAGAGGAGGGGGAPRVVRQDFDFGATHNSSGGVKSRLDHEGIHPANPDGATTPLQHISGNRDRAAKDNSPWTSFLTEGPDARQYGDRQVTVDMPGLQRDVAAGRLPGVEVLSPAQVQAILRSDIDTRAGRPVNLDVLPPKPSDAELTRFARALGLSNTTTKDVLTALFAWRNSRRDGEWLVKGVVPRKYLSSPYPVTPPPAGVGGR